MTSLDPDESGVEKQTAARLQPALISSFNPHCSLASPTLGNLSDAEFFEKAWPKALSIDVDLYLMMQNDAMAWAHCFPADPMPKTAFSFFSWMARQVNPRFFWRRIAETACENAARANAKIVAITSFFPEVNSAPNTRLGLDAPYVFASLMGIALEIAEYQSNFDPARVPTIQSVAGSIFTSFQHHRDPVLDQPNRPALHAKRSNDASLIQNLLDNVKEALEILKKLKVPFPAPNINQIRIPWELEPGNLYLFRDYRESLNAFEQQIESERVPANVRRCMAYNLDIPHWELCKSVRRNETIALPPSVEKRIRHAHISGHSERGHFGDFSLKRVSSRQQLQFKRWLSFIQTLPHCPTISLEFEAARCMADVRESAETLIHWLGTTAP